LMRVVQAENTYETAIPMRITTPGVTFLNMVKKISTAHGSIENRNAMTTIPDCWLMPRSIPRMTKRDTPSNAPLDIPVVYGSARGFLMMVCMTAPPIASIAPMVTHAIALGRK